MINKEFQVNCNLRTQFVNDTHFRSVCRLTYISIEINIIQTGQIQEEAHQTNPQPCHYTHGRKRRRFHGQGSHEAQDRVVQQARQAGMDLQSYFLCPGFGENA